MADAPIIKFKKRGAKAAPRKVAPPPPSDSSDLSSDSEAENPDGHVVKRLKTTSSTLKASTLAQKPTSNGPEGPTQYTASRSDVIQASSDATKQSNWFETDETLSAKALLGTTRAQGSTTQLLSSKPASFIQKSADAPPPRVGPQKSSSNVRTITVTDYTPDVCKDYKQTGFCGFGDNCKFAHAREDYAAGWKLDREWEVSSAGKKLGGTVVASANRGAEDAAEGDVDAEIAALEKIPFVCLICKESYTTPVVTKCGHYFCEKCALKRYRRDPTCAACSAKTYGVFNGAKNLAKLLERKRKGEEKKRERDEKEREKEKEDA